MTSQNPNDLASTSSEKGVACIRGRPDVYLYDKPRPKRPPTFSSRKYTKPKMDKQSKLKSAPPSRDTERYCDVEICVSSDYSDYSGSSSEGEGSSTPGCYQMNRRHSNPSYAKNKCYSYPSARREQRCKHIFAKKYDTPEFRNFIRTCRQSLNPNQASATQEQSDSSVALAGANHSLLNKLQANCPDLPKVLLEFLDDFLEGTKSDDAQEGDSHKGPFEADNSEGKIQPKVTNLSKCTLCGLMFKKRDPDSQDHCLKEVDEKDSMNLMSILLNMCEICLNNFNSEGGSQPLPRNTFQETSTDTTIGQNGSVENPNQSEMNEREITSKEKNPSNEKGSESPTSGTLSSTKREICLHPVILTTSNVMFKEMYQETGVNSESTSSNNNPTETGGVFQDHVKRTHELLKMSELLPVNIIHVSENPALFGLSPSGSSGVNLIAAPCSSENLSGGHYLMRLTSSKNIGCPAIFSQQTLDSEDKVNYNLHNNASVRVTHLNKGTKGEQTNLYDTRKPDKRIINDKGRRYIFYHGHNANNPHNNMYSDSWNPSISESSKCDCPDKNASFDTCLQEYGALEGLDLSEFSNANCEQLIEDIDCSSPPNSHRQRVLLEGTSEGPYNESEQSIVGYVCRKTFKTSRGARKTNVIKKKRKSVKVNVKDVGTSELPEQKTEPEKTPSGSKKTPEEDKKSQPQHLKEIAEIVKAVKINDKAGKKAPHTPPKAAVKLSPKSSKVSEAKNTKKEPPSVLANTGKVHNVVTASVAFKANEQSKQLDKAIEDKGPLIRQQNKSPGQQKKRKKVNANDGLAASVSGLQKKPVNKKGKSVVEKEGVSKPSTPTENLKRPPPTVKTRVNAPFSFHRSRTNMKALPNKKPIVQLPAKKTVNKLSDTKHIEDVIVNTVTTTVKPAVMKPLFNEPKLDQKQRNANAASKPVRDQTRSYNLPVPNAALSNRIPRKRGLTMPKDAPGNVLSVTSLGGGLEGERIRKVEAKNLKCISKDCRVQPLLYHHSRKAESTVCPCTHFTDILFKIPVCHFASLEKSFSDRGTQTRDFSAGRSGSSTL